MKRIKITKIYNGGHPILRIADRGSSIGNRRKGIFIEHIYEIIDIPYYENDDSILSMIDINKLNPKKSIMKYSDLQTS